MNATLPADEGASTRLSPWIALPLVAVVFCIPVLATVHPVFDWDIWWHLRTGQWIAEHGRLPDHDPFTAIGAQIPWVAYSWAFELLIHELYRRFGLIGIVGFRVALAVAVTGACYRLVRRREPRFVVAAGLAGIAAVVLSPLFNERPWLFTIVFAAWTLDVVLDLRAGRRTAWFWALPFVYLAWATLHIQFVYGFLILGLACAAPFLDRWLGGPATADARTPGTRGWWNLLGLTTACIAATLLAPYHARLYAVALEYATQTLPFRVIAELMAPEFRSLGDWLGLGLGVASVWCLGRSKSVSSFEVLFTAVALAFFVRARRDVWLVALAALAVVPGAIPRSPRQAIFAWSRARALAAVTLTALGAAAIWIALGLDEARCRAGVAARFPERAAEVVAQLPADGPLYSHLEWGGYLIWKLPQWKVTIDGRTNLHGEQRIERSLDTLAGKPGWERDRELLGASVVIARSDAALTGLLRRDPERFEPIYSDERATVFVSKHPAGR
ncbi:MAG: hypothetical protein E6J87_00735 [Deltaproteobacteria bacterium]|nr:MAG: hypothetical protein E6J87_00735 [Deltaproteobacteria bacterium]